MSDKPSFETAYKIFEGQPQQLAEIKEWEKSWRRAALTQNLYEHGEVKMLIDKLKGFVAGNETFLMDQKRSDYQSDTLYFEARLKKETENYCWNWFIHIFTKAESVAETVGGKVQEAIHQNNQ